MTKNNPVTIERRLKCDGIDVHGIRYQSSVLQRLRAEFGTTSVRVIPESDDVRYVRVWHSSRSIWIKVPLAEFERLATQGEIDELAFGLYSREHE
ncbi:hypothetical protein BF49_0797 [Bradyrhizobium sp.]|uniref:hypothetical protein n=1 Tax=Bradyrhizobium sp. TaxID=376 RepID=UPI0007C1D2C6|nr:hypothetical protein [Bradyrhizobium sp.]CUT09717.1 hypothetical protein BF49_0797 [Bradyrhizobium sp.]